MQPRRLVAMGMFISCVGLAAHPSASAAADSSLESARSIVSKWIATEDLIFRETKDWRESEDLIEARIGALESEVAAAEARLAEAQATLGELRKKRAETNASERELLEGSSRLVAAVAGLEVDVRRLFPVLPPAVQERAQPLYRRIPDDPATTKISVGERFQNVVGVLSEMHKANGDISLVTEIRALSDGKPSEVKTVYVGLGQAYFLSAGGESGVGHPTTAGWEWRAANELAGNVAAVIEILENKGKPRFVGLPVSVQ